MISQRNLQPPFKGPIDFAGFIDPHGNSYPVRDTTHAQWMLEHVDWLEAKGYQVPSSVKIMEELSKHQSANIRNILVKQGWLAIQSPARWHVRDIQGQAKQIEDAIHSRKVRIRPNDFPIELFQVDTDIMVRIDQEEFNESGITENMTRPQLYSWLHSKHGITKEALLNMQENVVMLREVMRKVNGEFQYWIVADAYDLVSEEDLLMKFRLALIESGLHKDDEIYDKQLNPNDPNGDYKRLVEKISNSLKQMVGPEINVITENEFGRDDRSAIYITRRVQRDFV